MTVSEAESEVFAPASIAPQFVEARLKGVSVPGYPGGVLPQSMDPIRSRRTRPWR